MRKDYSINTKGIIHTVFVSAVLVLSLSAIDITWSFAQPINQDFENLAAELFVKGSNQSNDLILESYHTPDGTYNPLGAEYPEEPNFKIQNGAIIGVRSTNTNFTVFPVDSVFYDVNEEKFDA